ncbi:MAG: cytochrome c biogenesis CcdA family protein [Jiangellaceae bacterium]
MLAAFNPCGFALLPAYLTLLVNQGYPVGRALAAAAAMTVGFVAVFGAFGLVVVPLALSLGTYLSWATVVVGVLLVLLGGWLLSGREFVVRLPRLGGAAPTDGVASMVLYGVAYAVASLSCTIAPFLAVTTSTFRSDSTAAGVAVFVAYGVGMGLVVGVLAVSVALARDGFVRRLRAVMPYVGRLSGALLLLAGAYVIYYGVYELRLSGGGATDDPVVSAATAVQGAVARFVDRVGPGWVLIALVLLTAVAVAVRRRVRSTPT